VRVRPRQGERDLRRREAGGGGVAHVAQERLRVAVDVVLVGLQRGVGAHVRARLAGAAERGPCRTPEQLAAQVVQREVDRPDGVDPGAAPAGHGRAHVEPLPQPLHVQGVRADQHLAQPQRHRVRARRLDAGACDHGVEVGLADPADAVVGDDLDHDRVLRRTGRGAVAIGVDQDMAVDIGDAHWSPI
jgi:hypothetical protein